MFYGFWYHSHWDELVLVQPLGMSQVGSDVKHFLCIVLSQHLVQKLLVLDAETDVLIATLVSKEIRLCFNLMCDLYSSEKMKLYLKCFE